ncbi:rod shape-determining protein [Phormidium sp. CLA17]|uniref:rod shape-determining protein n=1 Tax=Leptolyngbya sp. Cla-17 TaxID=2803751 RepID=UPI0014915F8B|nr:rod shape-determining protein [Leptolyngbya sp. Cla-17]MBM0742998.1 rod shape-determining protein [Leptolyngbya sp. Cla-17]
MMNWLTGNSTTCVRIRRNWLSVRVIRQGKPAKHYENSTEVVVQLDRTGKKKVVAVGREARSFSSSQVTDTAPQNAFDHPRLVIDDLEIAVATLVYFLQQAFNRQLFFAPSVIVHSLRELEGGLTSIERQLLLSLASQAGAREVFLFEGLQELSDDELLTSQPSDFQSKWKT